MKAIGTFYRNIEIGVPVNGTEINITVSVHGTAYGDVSNYSVEFDCGVSYDVEPNGEFDSDSLEYEYEADRELTEDEEHIIDDWLANYLVDFVEVENANWYEIV